MQMVIENLVTRQKKNILTLPQASLSLSSDMLVHWVKVIWAKDGGAGTPWGPTIFFSEKKSTSLNLMTFNLNLSHLIY